MKRPLETLRHPSLWALAVLVLGICACSRREAKPGDPEFVTCDIWTREPGTREYKLAQQDLSFVDYLHAQGFRIIPIDYADEMHYANNLRRGPLHDAGAAARTLVYTVNPFIITI